MAPDVACSPNRGGDAAPPEERRSGIQQSAREPHNVPSGRPHLLTVIVECSQCQGGNQGASRAALSLPIAEFPPNPESPPRACCYTKRKYVGDMTILRQTTEDARDLPALTGPAGSADANSRGCPDGAPASSEASLDSLRRIERTSQRLWALALILFLLISASLLIIDAASSVIERVLYDVTDHVRMLIDNYALALAFLTTVALACIYFREKLMMVRNENRELIRALDANARILAQRNHQLDTWEQLSHHLITNVNLPHLLDLVVKTAAEVTGSDCAAVTIVEPGSPHLRLAAIYRRGMQTELARRVAAKVISSGEPIHIRPECSLPEFDRPDLSWDGVGALAASPLMESESVTGCLLVGRLTPAQPYPTTVLSVLGSFANQASIAMEKAHLYGESQRQLRRLNKLLDELRVAQCRLAESSSTVESVGPRGPELSLSEAPLTGVDSGSRA